MSINFDKINSGQGKPTFDVDKEKIETLGGKAIQSRAQISTNNTLKTQEIYKLECKCESGQIKSEGKVNESSTFKLLPTKPSNFRPSGDII